MKGKLTNKQRLFVKEYLVDFNATQASIRAGYSKKTAYSQGQRLLKNVEIKQALLSAIHKRELNLDITADRVLQEMAILAFCDMKDYVEIDEDGSMRLKSWDEMPEGASRAVLQIKETVTTLKKSGKDDSEVLTRRLAYKHHSKEKALEMLGRYLALFNDKLDVNIKDYETFEMPALSPPGEEAKVPGGNGDKGNGGSSD